jgi:hypothetical protein
MRSGTTSQPTKIAEQLCASFPCVPASVSPCVRASAPQAALVWTSSPYDLPVALVSPSVSLQNAAVALPLDYSRRAPTTGRSPRITSHKSRITPFLIYGTGIKNRRISFIINKYKLLIYGKPPCKILCSSHLSFDPAIQRAGVSKKRDAQPIVGSGEFYLIVRVIERQQRG